jgi:hypothetical protein
MSEKDYENALGQFHKLPKWAREAIKNQLSALNLKIIELQELVDTFQGKIGKSNTKVSRYFDAGGDLWLPNRSIVTFILANDQNPCHPFEINVNISLNNELQIRASGRLVFTPDAANTIIIRDPD